MDLLARLTWMDLALLVVLAGAVFLGFTQGIIRYVLNTVLAFVAFIVAAQLKEPISTALSVWHAFPPEGRELFFFVLLYVALVIGFWFVVRAFYSRTRLPVAKQLDEIGGAIFAVAWAIIVITFHIAVFDTFYRGEGAEPIGLAGGYYTAVTDSVIGTYLRENVLPAIGYVARPFVPNDVAQILSS